ncbi:MAG: hypothetical protein D6760_10815 [Deltaproteobacteria bacterium]|nr:MAG: hypothetical protein D6760_10815 [Deltaproteobacteria bacterium]
MAWLMREIHRLVGFPDPHWDMLCAPLLDKLDGEGLELVRRALVVRQGRYLPPSADAEEIYAKRDVWTYAVFVAALRRLGVNAIPPMGREWIERDPECARALDAAGYNVGIIDEMLRKAGLPPAEFRFLDWLVKMVEERLLPVGVRGAPIHIVPDGVLIVRPKAFRALGDDWENVERRFLDEEGHPPLRQFSPRGRPELKLRGYVVDRARFRGLPEDVEVDDLEEIR